MTKRVWAKNQTRNVPLQDKRDRQKKLQRIAKREGHAALTPQEE